MVARVALVETVVHVATVIARSSTAGTQLLFNNSVRPAKKTHFTIMKISLLTLFKEIIAVYSENHKKHKEGQTYRLSSRWDRYLPLGFEGLISRTILASPQFRLRFILEIFTESYLLDEQTNSAK
jgi:hypothetical protein